MHHLRGSNCEICKSKESRISILGAEKDGAYKERNRLVAFLCSLFPASVEQHVGDDWEDDWRNVVYIDLPTGQASWHIHDSHLPLFDHVPRDEGRVWDGHTTDQKYARLDMRVARS